MRQILTALLCLLGMLTGPSGALGGEGGLTGRIPASGAWVAAAGRVEPASEEMRLGFDMPGKIREVFVEEGDPVKRGQPLARLVDDDIQSRLAQAQAAVLAAKASLDKVLTGARPMERFEAAAALREAETVLFNARKENQRRAKLVSDGVISREEADRAERDYLVAIQKMAQAREHFQLIDAPSREEDIRRAEAEYGQAQAQLEEAVATADKALIRSPIDGVVLRKHRRAGEMVSTYFDTPVVTVGDTSVLRVRADVDEKDVDKVHVGQKAYATADAYGDKRFEGRVVRIAQMLGRKNVRTDDPAERLDTKILEVLIEFDRGVSIPIGMRMDVFLLLDHPS